MEVTKKPNGLNNGEWISLGHVIKPFSHPLSEVYKCNYCGYEQYMLFNYPPRYCPKCGQRMENGMDLQEALQHANE